jgi:ribosomal protein S27AE
MLLADSPAYLSVQASAHTLASLTHKAFCEDCGTLFAPSNDELMCGACLPCTHETVEKEDMFTFDGKFSGRSCFCQNCGEDMGPDFNYICE